jgi:hypothetical protein
MSWCGHSLGKHRSSQSCPGRQRTGPCVELTCSVGGIFKMAAHQLVEKKKGLKCPYFLVIRRSRREPVSVVGRWLRRVAQGYFNYHAVPGNVDRLDAFSKDVSRAWIHALRRRDQRGRMPWARFGCLVERYLPRARVLHPYPHQRLRLDSRQEPYAVVPHVRTCGGRGVIPVPTATVAVAT